MNQELLEIRWGSTIDKKNDRSALDALYHTTMLTVTSNQLVPLKAGLYF
jgi:hypothetical protein